MLRRLAQVTIALIGTAVIAWGTFVSSTKIAEEIEKSLEKKEKDDKGSDEFPPDDIEDE